MTALLVATCLVFIELAKIINRDEFLKPLKKQVYVFMSVFLVQLFVRFCGMITIQSIWIHNNFVSREYYLEAADREQEI